MALSKAKEAAILHHSRLAQHAVSSLDGEFIQVWNGNKLEIKKHTGCWKVTLLSLEDSTLHRVCVPLIVGVLNSYLEGLRACAQTEDAPQSGNAP